MEYGSAMKLLRTVKLPGLWALHSYYTMPPWAPDGSGRLLLAGADLATREGEVFVVGPDGEIEARFGRHPVESDFFHTGFWQSWSPDGRSVYFLDGSLRNPQITRRELATGTETTIDGAMEGAPPDGEPVVSCLLGMLYAAGYGTGVYNPALSPVPFEERTGHGVFEYDFASNRPNLRLSVQQVLDLHPDRERLLVLDRELAKRNNTPTGLTLMCYCVRWSRDAKRMMFHFGNHCVVKERGEPKILYLFTCNRDFSDLRLALDLCGGGVHWSFHPGGEHLVGYAQNFLSIVGVDGTGFRKICDAKGGGHPSISPADPMLAVTDSYDGTIEFWDIGHNRRIDEAFFPNRVPGKEAFGNGRNEFRVCHHPVFSPDGRRAIFNVLEEGLSYLAEVEAPKRQ